MWCLWNLGRLAERIFDRWTYLLVYTASGIAGSLASLWWHPQGIGAGASGAIFGLAGGLIAVLYLGKLPIAKEALKPTLRSLVMFAAYNLFFGLVPGSTTPLILEAWLPASPSVRSWPESVTEPPDIRARRRNYVVIGNVQCSCWRATATSGRSQARKRLRSRFVSQRRRRRRPGGRPAQPVRTSSGLAAETSAAPATAECLRLTASLLFVTHQVRRVSAHRVSSLLVSSGSKVTRTGLAPKPATGTPNPAHRRRLIPEVFSGQACGVPPGTRWRRVSCRRRTRRSRRRSRDTNWRRNSRDRIRAAPATKCARHAVDQQPSSTLPHPTGRSCLVARQRIVHPEGAAHYEQPFGDFMRGAESRFAAAIHVEGSHLQVETLGFVRPHAPLDRGRLAKVDDVRLGRASGMRNQCKTEHSKGKKTSHPASLCISTARGTRAHDTSSAMLFQNREPTGTERVAAEGNRLQ